MALFLNLCLECLASCHDIQSLLKGCSQRFGLGRHFVEPSPPYRVVPLMPYAFVVVVHRSCRGVFAFEGVLGIEAPQPPVPRYPGRGWWIQQPGGFPFLFLSCSYHSSISSSVVHKGNEEEACNPALF